jgi:hypothetical protein
MVRLQKDMIQLLCNWKVWWKETLSSVTPETEPGSSQEVWWTSLQ